MEFLAILGLITFADISDFLGLIISTLTIVGLAITTFRVVDKRLDDLSLSIERLSHRLELGDKTLNLNLHHYNEQIEDLRLSLTSITNQLDNKIEHRSSVFQDQLDQLNGWLAKTSDFQIRRRISKQNPPE